MLDGFHGADLHRACLGAQEDGVVIRQVEGIAAVPGGVALLGVKLGEVILGKLDLRAVEDRVTHADENFLGFVQGLVHGVLMAQADGVAGDGDVQRFVAQLLFQGDGVQCCAALFQMGLDLGADLVGQLPDKGALLGGELAHLL